MYKICIHFLDFFGEKLDNFTSLGLKNHFSETMWENKWEICHI